MRGEVIIMSIDLDTTASWEYYDSRAVGEVYGRQKIVIYIWVKEAKVLYYKKDTWDKYKFEDTDHRMVTTTTLIVRSDNISVDHNGRKMSKFKDKIGEKYNVRLCRFDNISADPGKEEFSQVDQWVDSISVDHKIVGKYKLRHCKFNYIFEDKLEEESQVDQWLDSISVDNKGEMY